MNLLQCFITSSVQCQSQAVVPISTSRMYPQNGYFLAIVASELVFGELSQALATLEIGKPSWLALKNELEISIFNLTQ